MREPSSELDIDYGEYGRSDHSTAGQTMPTNLPPDYKPKPASDPTDPADPSVPGAAPAFPPPSDEDALDGPKGIPRPGPNVGVPGPGSDVVDPPGWAVPPVVPGEEPAPEGAPAF